MSDRSDSTPAWARRAVQAAPDLSVYQPVGASLPTWMRSSQRDWNAMREANVPHPGRWVRATDPDALKSLPAARRLGNDIIYEHIKQNTLGSNWVASQAALEVLCLTLPKAPDNHRFVLRAGIDQPHIEDPACVGLSLGNASLILETWKAGDPVEIEPVPVCPDLNYWVAQVQTSTELVLMVVSTDKCFEIPLASPGPVTVWAHGQEQTLVLPVAPARLDPDYDRLGYVIAYCQRYSLILPAFRPPEPSWVREDAD